MNLTLWNLTFEKLLAVNGKSNSESLVGSRQQRSYWSWFSRDTFSSVMNLGNDYAHQHSQQLPSMRPSQTPAARRLQRSREHLGFQRHDLLVAMRVINNIEREMLQAEWENWLLEENVKCKHLGVMLSHNTTGKNNNGRHVLDGESRRLEEARAWQKQYCDSCNKELETVVI